MRKKFISEVEEKLAYTCMMTSSFELTAFSSPVILMTPLLPASL